MKIFLIITAFLFPAILSAQSVEVSINRNRILIGEQVNYGLKVVLPSSGFKTFFSIPDSVAHFEVLRKEEVASVKGQPAVEQVITFTSFDSGSWYFPSIPVTITDGSRRINLSSDSILIHVDYMPIDSTGKPRDIKSMMEVKVHNYLLYYIIGGIILLLLLGYLLYRYLKKRKSRPKPILQGTQTPYDEAIQALSDLEKEDLLMKGEVKQFHTRLSDIFRLYYSRTKQVDMRSLTSGELLIEVRRDITDDDTRTELAEMLRMSDAVKFAKFQPALNDSKASLEMTRKAIRFFNNNYK